MLLRQADAPGDFTLTAQFLLAGLDDNSVLRQTRTQDISLEQIADNWEPSSVASLPGEPTSVPSTARPAVTGECTT
ncbi:hypothetical protein OHB12_08305 [Nocardia sp. NBC_01730]|uniref:hypothetical protein n=1 Tax=Nocardia sp. NBC_01730 TaxID=2975998 RepID=UPI002E10D567|nr:hypothetical protein OHB12_08305 [Nocardia sp. NBC_01730]